MLFPAILLLLFAGLITRAFRWRVLLDNELPFPRTFSIMNVAYLVNGVLPLRIGEVARVYLVSRTRKKQSRFRRQPAQSLSNVCWIYWLSVVMVLLALMMGPVPDEIRAASGIAALVAIIGFIILVFMAGRRDWSMKLFRTILQYIPDFEALYRFWKHGSGNF